jgi:hypothetical protein
MEKEKDKEKENYIVCLSQTEKYIMCSKQNIDAYMRNNDYQKAFSLFILVLGKLDDNDKNVFIEYYSKKIF